MVAVVAFVAVVVAVAFVVVVVVEVVVVEQGWRRCSNTGCLLMSSNCSCICVLYGLSK